MRRNRKQWIALVIVLSMCLSLCSVSAGAADTSTNANVSNLTDVMRVASADITSPTIDTSTLKADNT
ncbi:MAG: hypothetical protein LUG54_07195, partial [Clostridiales bacterium]|nr:hypothetical protein [Clostridiales bacterium]